VHHKTRGAVAATYLSYAQSDVEVARDHHVVAAIHLFCPASVFVEGLIERGVVGSIRGSTWWQVRCDDGHRQCARVRASDLHSE
jgi:hypothetical protein